MHANKRVSIISCHISKMILDLYNETAEALADRVLSMSPSLAHIKVQVLSGTVDVYSGQKVYMFEARLLERRIACHALDEMLSLSDQLALEAFESSPVHFRVFSKVGEGTCGLGGISALWHTLECSVTSAESVLHQVCN